jgi:hypothetical protein
MNNKDNQTLVNKVDALSMENVNVNEVINSKTITAIKNLVKKAYDEMEVADINKEVKMVQSKELAYDTIFMGDVNRFKLAIEYYHKDSDLSQPIIMVVKIYYKHNNTRFWEALTDHIISDSLKDDIDEVMAKVIIALRRVINWGVIPIKCEWSNMMDLYLQNYRTRRGNKEAQIVAVYNDEVIEGGWITADWDADEEDMITQALMAYWVNSEVVGTGRN